MLNQLFKRDFVIFDHGFGWMLFSRGLKPGQRPDIMNITAPEIIEEINREAVAAGSDIVCTNTFGANAKTLSGSGYTPEEIISAAVTITKRATAGKALTAFDTGPIGEFITPFGTLSFDESYELYRQQAVAAEKAGADLIAVETMSDLMEVKAVMLAVKENTSLPILVMMTFDKSGRTFTGCLPESFAITAERLGATAVGINCSLGPDEIYPIAERLVKATTLPVVIKPNAGLPNADTGGYDIPAAEFARQMARYAALGVKIVGGCCGTTPEYVREIKKTFSTLKPGVVERDASERVCTALTTERIDGFTPLPAADVKTSVDDIAEDALEQADDGLRILTVRLPADFSEEDAVDVIQAIQSQSSKPLYIESPNPAVLSAALRAVTGTAAAGCPSCPGGKLAEIANLYGAVTL